MWRLAVRDQGQNPHAIPPLVMALYAALAWAVLAASILVFRKRLFVTEVTRRLLLGVLCAFAGIVLNRALHALPVLTTADVVSADQLLAASASAVGAVTLARWCWILTGIFVAGALATRLLPQHAGPLFAASLFCSCAIGLWMVQPRSAAR
jgi:hypothetical protein